MYTYLITHFNQQNSCQLSHFQVGRFLLSKTSEVSSFGRSIFHGWAGAKWFESLHHTKGFKDNWLKGSLDQEVSFCSCDFNGIPQEIPHFSAGFLGCLPKVSGCNLSVPNHPSSCDQWVWWKMGKLKKNPLPNCKFWEHRNPPKQKTN